MKEAENVFFFKQKTAYELLRSLVCSEMCIRDRVIIGVFQIGLPYVFFAYGTKHVSALEAVLIPVLEPILNPVWVFLLMGEKPGRFALLGGFIVLLAIVGRGVILTLKTKKNPPA